MMEYCLQLKEQNEKNKQTPAPESTASKARTLYIWSETGSRSFTKQHRIPTGALATGLPTDSSWGPSFETSALLGSNLASCHLNDTVNTHLLSI